MPNAIPFFIGSIAQGIVTGLTAIGFSFATSVAILDFGIKLAALSFLSSVYRRLTGVPDFAAEARGQTLTTRGTLEFQRVIYGETLVSGPLAYMNAAGDHNQSLYHAVILAGHECEDVTDIWLDDNRIEEAAIDWAGNGSVDSGDFRGNLNYQTTTYFEKKTGGSNQSASTFLQQGFAEVTSQHQGRGLCYVVFRNDYFENQTQVWSAGAPKNYKALVKGKKVYNPASDGSQSFGTGPHRVNSDATWEYSNNPALCWADYMINSEFGPNINTSRIDYGYVASAAAICSGTVHTPVGTDVRFACNGSLSEGDNYRRNLDKILSSMNGTMVKTNGKWKLRAWGYVTPTLSFSDDDMRGPDANIQIKMGAAEGERFNVVRASFIDKDRLWSPQASPEFTSSEYVARDGGRIPRDIQLPMTTDVYMAQRLQSGVLEQSDLERSVIFPGTYKVIRAELGGTIQLNNTKMGWTDKVFRVDKYKYADMGGIDLVLKEDDSSAYADVATNEYTVSSQGSYVTAAPGVPAPSSLWVLDTPNNAIVRWTPPAARLFDETQIWANFTSNVLSDAALVYQGKNNYFEHRLDKPITTYYWSRSVNFTGALSDFFPNSDATDVVGYAPAFETLTDLTFDKSTNIYDYWRNLNSVVDSFSISVVQSDGLNNSNACRFINSFENQNLVNITNRVNHQIVDDTLNLRIHYRVNCHDTFASTNTVGIHVYGLGWSLAPIAQPGGPGDPPRYPPPTSGSLIVLDEQISPISSLTTTGSWDVVDFALDVNSAFPLGHKLGNFAVGISCAPNANSNYLDIWVDNVTYRYT